MTAIHTIDLEYLGTPGAIASYIVIGREGPVMIETGPGCTTDALTRGLDGLGLTPRDIRHVLVTHIHFDHAGASGWMAQHGATVYVHEFGQRHLIDPSRLMASARRIYGDSMDTRWGELIAIPESQVVALPDNDVIEVEGLKFRTIETPGHARHHHAYALDTGHEVVAFTGDAAACYVAESPEFISLPTPPPEFQLGAWLASIDRLDGERFDRLYPTHFGVVDDPPAHLQRVREALRAHTQYVRSMIDAGVSEDERRRRYADWFADHAERTNLPSSQMGFYVKDTMAAMNLTGMERYWRKLGEKMGVT